MSDLSNLRVPELKEYFKLEHFIETGYHEGKGIAYAKTLGFKTYWSCDIVGRFIDEGKALHKDDPNVTLVNCDSLAFLNGLSPDITPCLFWLDAHQPWLYDGATIETDLNKFPVMHELEIIKRRPGCRRDVIMIDDLIVIQGCPRWHPNEVSDYLQVNSFTFQQLLESMIHTHQAVVNLGQEGILTFIPGKPKS